MKAHAIDPKPLIARQSVEFELLYVLEWEPGLSQRVLSKRLGISLGKTNYCLCALAEKGWVRLENFCPSPDSARDIHVVTECGRTHRSALARALLKHKQAEFERLRAHIALLETTLLQPSEANRTALTESGFDLEIE